MLSKSKEIAEKNAMKQKDALIKKYKFGVLKPGDAVNYPANGDSCAIHYKAFLAEGMLAFDDSYERREPLYFFMGQNQVIQAIEDCMPLMSLKGRYSITCPPETAFGMKGYPPIIPPMATVIYEVELTTFTNAGAEERLLREKKTGVF